MRETSIYTAIHAAWDAASGHEMEQPPHLSEGKARDLDQQLSERFQPLIAQFNDGLISAVELFDMMTSEANREAQNLSSNPP